MAKGNRTINLYKDDVWKSVFFESVGTYVKVINSELSQEYPLEPLSDYIKIGGGYAFKTSEYKKKGIPIIRISDFNNEQIDISNCVYYDEDASLLKYELKENDIIICLTGGTIAKLGIVQSDLGKLYMNQRVGRFDILDDSKFEKEYVYWIARSVQSIIKNLAWGAAIPNVSPKQIEKLEFSFPPIEVQQQIIEFLNDLKNNTVQNRMYFNQSIERHIVELQNNNLALKNVNSELTHQLSLIKQLRQAFLREAMQGKLCHAELVSASEETGHELLAKINAEKTNLIKAKKLKAGLASSQTISLVNDIKIPSHWVWCKADEIFFITKLAGFEYSKHIKLSEHGEIPVIRAQNVRALNIDKKNLLYIDRQTSELLERCALTKKSLLVTFIGAGIGDVATFEEKERWHLAPNVAKMEPFIGCENLLSVKFINYFMMSDLGQKEIFKHVKATAQPSLSMGTIRDIDIPLPPLYEQEQIVAKLEELMAFCDGLEQSIKESQGYNEQLLQQVLREALSGEVKNK